MSIEQQRVMIARYMGMEGTDAFLALNYMYEQSWNLLMPVVEKIEKDNYGFKMCRRVVEIYYDNTKATIYTTKKASRLESLYDAVVWFVERHANIQKRKNASPI